MSDERIETLATLRRLVEEWDEPIELNNDPAQDEELEDEAYDSDLEDLILQQTPIRYIHYLYLADGQVLTFIKQSTFQEMKAWFATLWRISDNLVSILVKCPWMPDRIMFLPEALEEYYSDMQLAGVVVPYSYGMSQEGLVVPTSFGTWPIASALEVQMAVAMAHGDWEVEVEGEDEDLPDEMGDEERLV